MIHSPFDFSDKRVEWSDFLKQIRAFFEYKGFTEVTTQCLVSVGAFESTIDTLKVEFSDGRGELHTSPEIEMKSVLKDFHRPIYQICKCFRDDPKSPIHSKEFTMLEFYLLDISSSELENFTIELISHLLKRSVSAKIFSINALIEKLTGIDLESVPTQRLLFNAAKAKTQIHLAEDDSWSDIFFKIMLDVVEPSLPPDEICLINEYPKAVSPLSKPIIGTSKAQRFEIYWKNMELCNGCAEISDEILLRQRYREESENRLKTGKAPHPEPMKLFQSASCMDNVAGVAVGLERLFSAITTEAKSP